MKKDLKSFITNATDSPIPELSNENLDSLNRLVGRYSSMSTDELFNEINKGRMAGSISDSDINNLYNLIGPMLPPEQQKRLADIILKLNQARN